MMTIDVYLERENEAQTAKDAAEISYNAFVFNDGFSWHETKENGIKKELVEKLKI